MARYTGSNTPAGILILIVLALGLTGWIANIVKFVGMIGDNEVTTMFIARVIGIPIGLLGTVLGYF